MRGVLFFLMILTVTNARCSKLDSNLVADIFKSAVEKMEYNLSINKTYSDSLVFGGFDFNTFKPKQDVLDDDDIYILYYLNKKIVAIKHMKKGVKDYILSLKHTDSYIYYSAFVYSSNIEESGFFAQGIFVYDKKLKTNMFFGIYHKALKLPLYIDQREGKIEISRSSSIGDVHMIFKLDRDMKAVTRLNYYNNELLSFSYICSESDSVYEEMAIYAKETCEEGTRLNEISMLTLFYLLKGGLCSEGILVNVEANYNNDKPYWSINEAGYLIKEE